MTAARWTPSAMYRLTLSEHFSLTDAVNTVHIAAERGFDSIRLSPIPGSPQVSHSDQVALAKLSERIHTLGMRLVLEWEPEQGKPLLSAQDPALSPRFEETHAPLLEWLNRGIVDGVSIHHVDSLPNPSAYLARIRQHAPFVVTEKRLTVFPQGEREASPASWRVSSSSSYPLICAIDGALTDESGFYFLESLRQVLATSPYTTIGIPATTGEPELLSDTTLAQLPDLARQLKRNPTAVTGLLTQIETASKRHVAANDMHSIMHELAVLTQNAWDQLDEHIRELLGENPVAQVSEEQLEDIFSALAAAIPVARADSEASAEDPQIFLSSLSSGGNANSQNTTVQYPTGPDASNHSGANTPSTASRLGDFLQFPRLGTASKTPPPSSAALTIARAISRVRSTARADVASDRLLAYIGYLLTMPGHPVATRFAQTTSAVMIRGLTNRAHYQYCALAALCEVGGSPAKPRGITGLIDELGVAAHARKDGVAHVAALTTPLTKFTAHERARALSIAEVPTKFAQFLRLALRVAPIFMSPMELGTGSSIGGSAVRLGQSLGVNPGPASQDLSFNSYVWQVLIALWDAGQPDELLRSRMESGFTFTVAGAAQSAPVIDGVRTAIDACFTNAELRAALDEISRSVDHATRSNELVSQALHMLSPAIPEVYDPHAYPAPGLPTAAQVRERFLELSAVPDPTNPAHQTGASSRIIPIALGVRSRHGEALTHHPRALSVQGPESMHVVGYAYRNCAVVGVRLPIGLADIGGFSTTTVDMETVASADSASGGRVKHHQHIWQDALTGRVFTGPKLPLAQLLSTHPVAILERLPQT